MGVSPRRGDRPLVLYGYGRLGRLAEEIFNELEIPIMIWDKKLPCPVAQYYEDFLLAICVASEPYAQVIAPLVAAGWTNVIPVWEIINAYPEVGIGNGWMAPWEETSFEEEDECDAVMSRFSDQLSKIHYERNHLGWRRIHYEQPDIEIMPKPTLPSTLVDIRNRQYTMVFTKKYLKEFHYANIHCEGNELITLEANMHLFKKYRPRISCACYHSRDGLWRIQKFLMDNLPDYQWTFRLHAYQGQAAFIYGCPNERSEK